MVKTITTTLSGDELCDLIRSAVKQEMCDLLPQVVKNKGVPISRRELMNRLNVSEPTLIRWERKGVIPSLRIGSAVRYDLNAVVEALEKKGGSR